MRYESPERGAWMLERNGHDLFEGVESPPQSGRFRCKLCALAGVETTLERRKFDSHRRAHERAATSKTTKESDGMAEVARPDGDLKTQLHRITKRIASTQHQLAHPETYSKKTGKWTPEQRSNLESKLEREKALREQIRGELAAEAKPADAAETKKETLDGGGSETKKEQAPKSPQVTPDPRKKPATSRKAAAKSTAKKKTTTARGRKAATKTTSRKRSTSRKS